MTRQDIEREFTVKDGSITSKGKFEGEPVYAPYFWDQAMNGYADWDRLDTYDCLGRDEFQFNITTEHRQLFPELGKAKTVRLAELDNGAVVTDTRE